MLSLLSTIALGIAIGAHAPQGDPVAMAMLAAQDAPGVPAGTPAEGTLPDGSVAAPAAGSAEQGPGPVTGLPQRPPEPRTMAAYWPVFLLLSLSWIGFVAYLLSIGRSAGRIAALLEGGGGKA